MNTKHHVIDEPKLTLFLLQNPKFAWFWLIVRVYVGWQWLVAGWAKIGSSAWTGADSGIAISNFVNGALAKMSGAHPDVQSWYGWFLSHVILPYPEFWSHVITYGEVIIGIALIVGIFTGIAAFFGFFLNLNFLLAGTVSINPVLMLFAIAIILAWRVAGFFGLDYWVLPAVGTPWSPGTPATEK